MKSWFVECEADQLQDIMDALNGYGVEVVASMGMTTLGNGHIMITIRCRDADIETVEAVPGIIKCVPYPHITGS